MPSPSVLAIGDAMIDHFFFLNDAVVNCELKPDTCLLCMRFGDKIPVEGYAATVAGNAANVAVGFARLGYRAALATTIGHDVGGREIMHRLMCEHVDTHFVHVDNRVNTNVSAVVSFQGERTILLHHVKRRYKPLPAHAYAWIYFTTLGPELREVARVQRLLRRFMKQYGGKLAYNPGSFQLRLPRKTFLELLPTTEVLFVNKEEAQLIAGMRQPPEKPHDLLFALAKYGTKTIVMTDGERGAYAYDRHHVCFCPPFPGRALERTGAGDSFGTGVVAALAAGKDVGEALRWGSANAASVVQKVGPQAGLLHEKEMQRALRTHTRIQPKKI